tara:strand:- start:581 stop:1006 length:426 start_codon:yes stop_codon:yes gene_type:complete
MRIYKLNIFNVFVSVLSILFILNNNLEANNLKKQWGNISIELKKTRFMGKNVQLEFIFENLSEEDVSFSSLLQLEARSGEGDRGELDFTHTDCDGTIPPLGFFKCKIQFNFPTILNVVSAQIGAGILTKAVFFKIQKQKEI